MSSGRLGSEDAATAATAEPAVLAETAPFADALGDDEAVRLSWEATGVRWADERWTDLPSPTAFVATDRRIVFETGDTATAVDYDRIRAVKIDAATGGRDVSTALAGCGGVCLLVGVIVAASDFANGAGLVLVSLALLAAGSATAGSSDEPTITVIIGNERQRLSFSADEDVGAALTELVTGN